MMLITLQPNPNGGYSGLQECSFSEIPENMALWPENIETEIFYNYNGFVVLDVEEVNGVQTVIDYIPNIIAYEAWKDQVSEMNAKPPDPIPMTEEETIRSNLDYLACLLGVEL